MKRILKVTIKYYNLFLKLNLNKTMMMDLNEENVLIKKPNEDIPFKYYPVGIRSITWYKLKRVNGVKYKINYWADARAQPYVEGYLSNFYDSFTLVVYDDKNPSETRKKFIKIINYFGFCYDIVTREELSKYESIDINKFTEIVRSRFINKFISKHMHHYTYDCLSDELKCID